MEHTRIAVTYENGAAVKEQIVPNNGSGHGALAGFLKADAATIPGFDLPPKQRTWSYRTLLGKTSAIICISFLNAFPLWLIAFFSSSESSAKVLSKLSGTKIGS